MNKKTGWIFVIWLWSMIILYAYLATFVDFKDCYPLIALWIICFITIIFLASIPTYMEISEFRFNRKKMEDEMEDINEYIKRRKKFDENFKNEMDNLPMEIGELNRLGYDVYGLCDSVLCVILERPSPFGGTMKASSCECGLWRVERISDNEFKIIYKGVDKNDKKPSI